MQSMRFCRAASEDASCCISSPVRYTLQGPTETGVAVTVGSAGGVSVSVWVTVVSGAADVLAGAGLDLPAPTLAFVVTHFPPEQLTA